jgi:hypothetical protein
MNRFLLGGCLMVMFGCGARTDYFTDMDGTGGPPQGVAGAPGVAAGAPNAGGATPLAGAPGFGAGPNTAGAPSFGGASPFAGSPGVAGAIPFAGAPGFGGVPNAGGAGGEAGSGATSGVVEACQVIAGNSCEQCLCTACSPEIVQCFSNLGCAVILACAQQTNCRGVACYSPKNCRAVIDQFGGLGGRAMRDLLSLLTCSVGSQNSCNCN